MQKDLCVYRFLLGERVGFSCRIRAEKNDHFEKIAEIEVLSLKIVSFAFLALANVIVKFSSDS